MDRYFRNIGAISTEEQEKLKQCSVCIVGLGGLGGYVLELFARLGIGSITGIDFDCFDITNLNRQLLSNESTIGCEKAVAAAERVKLINDEVKFTSIRERLTAGNACELLAGYNIVIDALDGIEARLIVGSACADLNIPLVHGAVNGWCGQAAVIYPGDETLERLYSLTTAQKRPPSVLPFTPAALAAFQVSLAVRVLLDREKPEPGTLTLLDLLTCSVNEIKI
jgi:molybdopterin/thiamine biosynthesis adenylyltransferase